MGNQPCFKCRGNGFTHESSMKHDKPALNQRCFFCKDCSTCQGSGLIAGNHGYGFQPQYGLPVYGPRPCVRCQGNGFYHDSNQKHDKAPNQKCFFCEKCKTCNGTAIMP